MKEAQESAERQQIMKQRKKEADEKHRLFVTARIQKRRLAALNFTRDPGQSANSVVSFVHQPKPVSNLFVHAD